MSRSTCSGCTKIEEVCIQPLQAANAMFAEAESLHIEESQDLEESQPAGEFDADYGDAYVDFEVF